MREPILAFLNLPGGTEWVVILIIAVLLFGHRLPDIARSIGKSLSAFKKGLKEAETDLNHSDEPPKKSPPPSPPEPPSS